MPDETPTKPIRSFAEWVEPASKFLYSKGIKNPIILEYGKTIHEMPAGTDALTYFMQFAEAYAAVVSKASREQHENSETLRYIYGKIEDHYGQAVSIKKVLADLQVAEARISELERERNRVADLVEEAIANFPRCKWSERAERELAEIRSKP